MDPKKLILVLEVAERGSVSRAAEALNVAQPSLSRTISDFEMSVGLRIFDRGPKGVTPTAGGARLLAHARAIRAVLGNAEEELTGEMADDNRPIAVGIVPVLPLDSLMEALRNLVGTRPGLRVRFDTGTREQLLGPLVRGEIDMIVGPLPMEPLGDGYVERVVYYEELAIYCGRASPFFRRDTVTLADLTDVNWVLGASGALSRLRVEAFLRSHGLAAPRVHVEIEDIPARRSLVVQSDFLSVFQRHHVLKELRDGGVFALPIPWGHDDRPFGVIRLAGVPMSSPAARFIDLMHETFARSGVRMGSVPERPVSLP